MVAALAHSTCSAGLMLDLPCRISNFLSKTAKSNASWTHCKSLILRASDFKNRAKECMLFPTFGARDCFWYFHDSSFSPGRHFAALTTLLYISGFISSLIDLTVCISFAIKSSLPSSISFCPMCGR